MTQYESTPECPCCGGETRFEDCQSCDGGSYDLSEDHEHMADGRGQFTEDVVTTLHAIDARWGHVDKIDGTGSLSIDTPCV